MTAAIIIPLARGCSSPPVGLSARGTDYLPGAPHCALASASLCQEAADYAAAVSEMHDRAPPPFGRSVLGGSCGAMASSALGPGRGLSMLPGTYPMRGGSPSEWASLSEPGRRPSRFPGTHSPAEVMA